MTFVVNAMRAHNYELQELQLSNNQTQLNAKDVVMIVAPTQDLSETEYKILKYFLSIGEKLYYVTHYGVEDLPYFDMLLSLYGLTIDKGLIVENIGYVEYYYRNQLYLMPDLVLESKESTMRVMDGFEANDYVLLLQSQAIRIPDKWNVNIQYNHVLTTSSNVYIKDNQSRVTTLECEKRR